MVKKTVNRVQQEYSEINVVVLEEDALKFQEACWFRPSNDVQHIILAEVDAAIKGLSLALQ